MRLSVCPGSISALVLLGEKLFRHGKAYFTCNSVLHSIMVEEARQDLEAVNLYLWSQMHPTQLSLLFCSPGSEVTHRQALFLHSLRQKTYECRHTPANLILGCVMLKAKTNQDCV